MSVPERPIPKRCPRCGSGVMCLIALQGEDTHGLYCMECGYVHREPAAKEQTG